MNVISTRIDEQLARCMASNFLFIRLAMLIISKRQMEPHTRLHVHQKNKKLGHIFHSFSLQTEGCRFDPLLERFVPEQEDTGSVLCVTLCWQIIGRMPQMFSM